MAWPRLWSSRDRAELARLRESEARYRLLAEHIGDVLFQYDMKGVVLYVSPSVAQFGYRPEDLVGRRVRDFLDPSTREQQAHFGAMVLAGERLPGGADNEFRFLRQDGEWVWLEGNPAIVHGPDGEVLGAVTIARDISVRRKLEDELRRKRAEAEGAAVAKSEFLANMSHEIRTPLTAVIGFAGLLAKIPDLPAKARLHVERIAKSGEALNAIVNNVLDFSKVEAGQIELRPEPVELSALIADAAALVEEEVARKGLSLEVALAEDVPARVMADAGRLRQVLVNLLSNAVKFTDRGGVALEVRREAGARLRVAVRDTGVGVPPEQAGRLFQRFSQIDGSSARRFGGAGLGLAISKGLVELMGGEIGVESGPGAGSTFWFTLAAPGVAAPEPAAAETEPEGPTRRARVLVVDDARANRDLILAVLDPFSLEVSVAADGVEAVEVAGRTAFDLVLMDLHMPGMDGIAAARAIRTGSGLNQTTPIVAVSASVQPADVEACRNVGMNDHVPKPINPRELLAKVAHWTAMERPAA